MRYLASLLLSLSLSLFAAPKALDIYFVDVEGGQATLIVTPSGQSILVDAGWPGYNKRDALRIQEAAKHAKVKQIDYFVLTHYHTDHVGGVAQLIEKIPVKNFVDHGPNNEQGKSADELSAMYDKAVATGHHIVVKPGDKIPLKGVDVTVVQANGEHIAQALPGGGQPNPLCAEAPKFPNDPSENARSVGFVLQFGQFRFVDLGDLTSAKELGLACPNNLIGPVSVYLTTHHGLDQSNAKAIVHALHPKVAIMNNGAKKGGSPSAWQIIRSSPGLQDMWQGHFAMAGGKENNVPDSMIANLEEQCGGRYLKLSANQDGSFTIENQRNKFSRSYR